MPRPLTSSGGKLGLVSLDTDAISMRTRFQVAMVLAMAADAVQIVLLPLFVEGAESPPTTFWT